MRDQKCCGTCTFHLPQGKDVFVCNNEMCDCYTVETEYGDGTDCIDYEAR